MSERQKLAVILFADVAGYTAMMQEDEKAALVTLNRFKEILERNVANCKGEVIQWGLTDFR